jgi:uncharacterized protein YjhX (UPF0386 family)
MLRQTTYRISDISCPAREAWEAIAVEVEVVDRIACTVFIIVG